jgi:hypothetical protein
VGVIARVTSVNTTHSSLNASLDELSVGAIAGIVIGILAL